MFTGIIAEVGQVRSLTREGGLIRFGIEAPLLAPQLAPGDSIAVNGVCQTVVRITQDVIFFDSVHETLRRTNLIGLRYGSRVNLEPALRLGDRLSGHFVSGHVDGTGVIRSKRIRAHRNVEFVIQIPDELRQFVHSKGSICFDGVSLTIKAVKGSMIEVSIIPYTLEKTILRDWRVGSVVNVEIDMIARCLSPGMT